MKICPFYFSLAISNALIPNISCTIVTQIITAIHDVIYECPRGIQVEKTMDAKKIRA